MRNDSRRPDRQSCDPDDGLELLSRLSTRPQCMVTMMEGLRWDGCRFKHAVHLIRERGIRLYTDGDAETIRVLRASYADAARDRDPLRRPPRLTLNLSEILMRSIDLPLQFVRALLITALLVLAWLSIAAPVMGCAESKSQYRSTREVGVDRDGNPFYRERTESGHKASAPGATSQPTTSASSRSGAGGEASGVQAKPASAYASEQRAKIYGWGVVGCAIAAAVSVYFRQWMLALGFAAAAALLVGASLVAELDSRDVMLGVGLLIAAGVVWAIARAVAARSQNKSAADATAKLALEGKFSEAIAAWRQAEVAQSAVKKAKAATR